MCQHFAASPLAGGLGKQASRGCRVGGWSPLDFPSKPPGGAPDRQPPLQPGSREPEEGDTREEPAPSSAQQGGRGPGCPPGTNRHRLPGFSAWVVVAQESAPWGQGAHARIFGGVSSRGGLSI